jgi:hypothetical protein
MDAFSRIARLVIIIAVCSACTTKVVRPESITLAEALIDIKKSLDAMASVPSDRKHGLMPAEATVEFDVTVTDKTGTEVGLEIVPTGIVNEIARVGGKWSTEVSSSRGNHITIKFRNIIFASENELVAKKSPKELTEIFSEFEKEGWIIFRIPPTR